MRAESPDPSKRRCRECKEWKHRQRFVPLHNRNVYDTVCVDCRKHKEWSGPTMRIKHIRGIISDEAYERRKGRVLEKKRAVWEQNKINAEVAANKESWERPERSAKAALRLLGAYPFRTSDTFIWGQIVVSMIEETMEKIKEDKTKEKLPSDCLLFWYDVIPGMAQRLRRHIDEYPGEESPIQVM